MAELTAASARSQAATREPRRHVMEMSDSTRTRVRRKRVAAKSAAIPRPAGGRSSGMLDGIAACSRSLPACGLPLELALRRGYAVGIVDLSWTSMKRLNIEYLPLLTFLRWIHKL